MRGNVHPVTVRDWSSLLLRRFQMVHVPRMKCLIAVLDLVSATRRAMSIAESWIDYENSDIN